MWQSTNEAPRHRAAAVTGTTSRRWRLRLTLISTQAPAVERPILELSNVLRAVLVRVDPFSFHAAGLGRALVGREGVHGAVSLWLPGGTTGLGSQITGGSV